MLNRVSLTISSCIQCFFFFTQPPILLQCDSEFVTKYYGSYLKGSKLWIIMEYLGGGSALDLMKAGPCDEASIAILLREILKGLDYLHTKGKIHRDIKGVLCLLGVS